MDYAALLANIEYLLKQRGLSADAASRRAGHVDAIRNLRRRVEGGPQTSWKLETLCDVAKALGVEAWELLQPMDMRKNALDLRSIVREEVKKALPPTVKKPRRRAG